MAVAPAQNNTWCFGYLPAVAGCPRQLTPIRKTSTLPAGSRIPVIQDFATMVLLHAPKSGPLKNTLDLSPIHHQLKMDALYLTNSGASNILLSKVSFDCLIRDSSGKEIRDYITFDLKIPGVNNDAESVFTLEHIRDKYGSKDSLYSSLKHFYQLGRSIVNPTDQQHGQKPAFDAQTSKHDQYIRHTEQWLVAYLALPEAATMLSNRLFAEIRGKYPEASSLKVYNMGLHMHSTKTCCAVCEYSLVGLMNERQGWLQNGKERGFLSNFKQACSAPNDLMTITLPQHSPFRLLVTVSAINTDAHHGKSPQYLQQSFNQSQSIPPFPIAVKHPAASNRIFTAYFDAGYDRRAFPSQPSLSHVTVGISGSKETPGSPGTINRVRWVRQEEMNRLEELFSSLKLLFGE